jgi:hypothetical protein
MGIYPGNAIDRALLKRGGDELIAESSRLIATNTAVPPQPSSWCGRSRAGGCCGRHRYGLPGHTSGTSGPRPSWCDQFAQLTTPGSCRNRCNELDWEFASSFCPLPVSRQKLSYVLNCWKVSPRQFTAPRQSASRRIRNFEFGSRNAAQTTRVVSTSREGGGELRITEVVRSRPLPRRSPF